MVVGDMLLASGVGDVEHPHPDPEVRRSFLVVAAVIFQEWRRQGRWPEEVARTYW
ncbi:hypothetical protein ACIPPM_15185 [Streptomyces sp. NPDC090119]|uniref:hypothetical protein n=1 Tax=Streptomyces sp. NPDC090119 TaxID=3365951 RepID=UPI0037FC1D2E